MSLIEKKAHRSDLLLSSMLGVALVSGSALFGCDINNTKSHIDTVPNSDSNTETQAASTDTQVEPWVQEWNPFEDMPDCQHVEVVEECSNGWCKIPKGCFVMGSPPDEWGRSPYKEDQVTVILDQSFEIMQYEVTLKEWIDIGIQKPERHPGDTMYECLEDNCPVDTVSWWASLVYANRLSENKGLTRCYVLEGCIGEPHEREFTCQSATTAAPTLYECEGYRLPTEAEWEYAARASTQTSYYAGPSVPSESTSDCSYQPYLVDIAWYCYNAGYSPHPVGQKTPNAWGLYDMLGNLEEWTSDRGNVSLPEGPVHNLNGELESDSTRTARGGLYYSNPSTVTASKRLGIPTGPNTHCTGDGFRLVRTLPE